MNKTLSVLFALSLLVVLGMALATPVLAANEIKLDNPLGPNATIPSVLKRIFNQVTYLLAFVVPIIIIVGAFQMMLSAGNPEKFSNGQKTIVYAIIGFVIVLMANGIIAIVQRILTPTV